jgi:hypothetical protein
MLTDSVSQRKKEGRRYRASNIRMGKGRGDEKGRNKKNAGQSYRARQRIRGAGK